VNWGIASHWWADRGASNYVHADQHVIIFHPQYNGTTNRTMFIANDGGIFKTVDARAAVGTDINAVCNRFTAIPWTSLNNNYGVTQFYHGLPYPDGVTYFGGTQDNGVLRGSDGAGTGSWGVVRGGDGGYVAVDPINPNIIYAEEPYLSLIKSVDGGINWVSATNGITRNDTNFLFIAPFTMDPTDRNRLWLGGTFELWRSTDGAGSWSPASKDVGLNITAVAVCPTDPNKVVAGIFGGGVMRSDTALSAGPTTVWPQTNLRLGYISWVAFDPRNSNTLYATVAEFKIEATDHHVYKSTDFGATWTGIDGAGSTGIPDIPVHCILVDPDQ
jgi:hypothetical protein